VLNSEYLEVNGSCLFSATFSQLNILNGLNFVT
jgi:hypothetical protein